MRLNFFPLQTFLMLGACALLAPTTKAEEACCKNGQCENTTSENTYGLTGDWGGYRTALKQHGVEVNANYTGEIFANPTGGKKHGSVFDGLLKLSLDVNLEKAAGLPDATFRISGLYPHGTSGSYRNVGDTSLFSNLDAFDSYRLVDLWIEQKFAPGNLSLKVGQMRVDDEFGVTDSAVLFINSTFGVPNPPATPMPIAAYPLGALGARVRFEPVEGLYGLAGIYDGNPSSGDFGGQAKRHGTDWALRSSEGTLYVGEAGYQRSACAYAGAVRVGLLYHTKDFADVRTDYTGKVHGSSTSTYYVVDQTVWQKSKDSKEAASVFIRGTLAEKSTAFMSTTTQVGAVYSGVTSSEDKLGVAFARNQFSPGQTSFGAESITEISYQRPLSSSIRVQPDLQYISRPGGTGAYQNAWVIGVRAVLDF
jgi:porin